MTNADAIRRMSDEQLDTFLAEWECGDIDYSITFCDLCKDGGNELDLDCDGCRRHWLKSDAKEYGGLLYWDRMDEPQYHADVECNYKDCDNCGHQSYCPQREDEPQTEIKIEPNWVGTSYGRFETEPQPPKCQKKYGKKSLHCVDCTHYGDYKICDYCDDDYSRYKSFYEPTDKPQTERSSDAE